MLVGFIVTFALLVFRCDSRGPHHPRGEKIAKHHVHYRPTKDTSTKLTQDKELLHDIEHIQEHLDGVAPETDLSALTDEEVEFYYFQLHDTDHNTKLDGLEMLQAIVHTRHQKDSTKDSTPLAETEDFQFYIELIDRVLKEDDGDNDGFLSYPEYVEGRKKEQSEALANPIVNLVK